jgi:hypothetical protein
MIFLGRKTLDGRISNLRKPRNLHFKNSVGAAKYLFLPT